MTQLQSFCLYLDTILIVVFALIYIVRVKGKASEQDAAEAIMPDSDESAAAEIGYAARSEGSIRLVGVEEELVPVILAGVSASMDVPISALKIKSISSI